MNVCSSRLLRQFACALLAVFAISLSVARAKDVNFESQIRPIVEARCINCHKAPYTDDTGKLKEPKAGLRLDSYEHIMKGSKNGPVIVAGKPDESPFYTLVILDPDDDDVMPAKGDPVTESEARLIRQWIEEGAKVTKSKGDTVRAKPVVKPARKVDIVKTLSKGLKAPDEIVMESLRESGFLVLPLFSGCHLLRVDASQSKDAVGDAQVASLSALKDHIFELNLAGTGVTDAGLKHLGKCIRLTTLHLENTGIGDEGVTALKGLRHLAYLNLYGTPVTDDAVKALSRIKSLERLYLWQTQISDDGAAELAKVRPGLKISRGWQAERVKIANEDIVAKFLADACCDKAHKAEMACTHSCCVKAVAEGHVCESCNVPKEVPPAISADIVAKFQPDSCCDKAQKGGAVCDHACCVKAIAEGHVCEACNPPKEDLRVANVDVVSQFKADSCCDKAHKAGKACEHGCCVEALAKGQVCEKCNPR